MQLLSDILLNNKDLYTLNIDELIKRRLEFFQDQGLYASLYYQSKITDIAKLSMKESDLNRILFNILAFIKHHNSRLKVEVNNDSRFLSLSFSCTGRRFPSQQKGFFLLSPQRSKKSRKANYLNSVSTLVRESGGLLTYSKTSPSEWCLDLQIPLSPQINEFNSFPQKERIPVAFNGSVNVLRMAPSKEGVFFGEKLSRCYGRLVAL